MHRFHRLFMPVVTILVCVASVGALSAEQGHESVAEGTTVLLSFIAEDPTPEKCEDSDCVRSYSRQFLKSLSESSIPMVEILDARGRSHRSEIEAMDGSDLLESLYVFRGVSEGTAKVIVSGRHWKTTTIDLEVPAQDVFTPEPVMLQPGGQLQLTVGDSPAAGEAECGAALDAPEAVAEVILYDCGDASASVTPSRAVLQRCTTITSRRLDQRGISAVIDFPGLAPGQYVLATTLGDRVVNVERAEVEASRTSVLQMPFARYYVAGRVTREARGVAASVRFLTGSAVTDPETGEYYALLSGAPGSAVVHVVGCDESFVYMHRPVTDVPNGPGYDLYLPPNSLVIDVIDASTRAALPDASVTVSMVQADDPSRQIGGVPAFADGDRFRVENLDEGVRVVACADLSGYRRACGEPLTVRKKTEEVTVPLAPLDRKGIVHASGYTTIHWVRPDGTISESAPIDERGEFHYALDHAYDHLVLVGSAPLWVTRAPSEVSRQETLELDPPVGAVRAIQLRVGETNPRQTVTVLLWVNGLPVPIPALSEHQRRRGQRWLIVDRAPMVVSGLFAEDSLAVAEGPDPDTYPGFLDPGAPIFAGREAHPISGPEFVFN